MPPSTTSTRRPTRASTRLRKRQGREGSDFDAPVGACAAKNGHDGAAGDDDGAGGGGRIRGRRRAAVAASSSESRRRKSGGAKRSFGTDVSNLPPPAGGGARTDEKKRRRSKDTTTALPKSRSKRVASFAGTLTAVRSPKVPTAKTKKNEEKCKGSTRRRRERGHRNNDYHDDDSRSAEEDREIEEGRGGGEEVFSTALAGEGRPAVEGASISTSSSLLSSPPPPSSSIQGSPFGSISPIPADDGATPKSYHDGDGEEKTGGSGGGSGSAMNLCTTSSEEGAEREDGSEVPSQDERRRGAKYPATTPGRRRERIRHIEPGGEDWSEQARNTSIAREVDLMSSKWEGKDGVGDEESSPGGSRKSRRSGTVDTSLGGTDEYVGRDEPFDTSNFSDTSTTDISRGGVEEEAKSYGTVDAKEERDADGGEAFDGSQLSDTIDASQGGTEDSRGASEADRLSGTVDTSRGGTENQGASKGEEKGDARNGESSSPSATIIRNDAERLLKRAKNSLVDDEMVMSAMLNSGKKGRRRESSGGGGGGGHGGGHDDAAALVMGRPRTERVVGSFQGATPLATPRGNAIGPMETFTIERRAPDEESVCSEVTAATLDSAPPVDDRRGDERSGAGREGSTSTSAAGAMPVRRGGSHALRPRQQQRAQVPRRAGKAPRGFKSKARYGRRGRQHRAELSSIPEASPEGSSGEGRADEDADERLAVDHSPDGRSRGRTSPPEPIKTSRSLKRSSKEGGRGKRGRVNDDEDNEEVPPLECEDDCVRHMDGDEDDYGKTSLHEEGGSNDVVEDDEDERSILERCAEEAGESRRRTRAEKRKRSSVGSGRKLQVRKKTPVSTGKIRMAHVHPICSLQKLGALLLKPADTKREKSSKRTSMESKQPRSKSLERKRPRTKSTERKRPKTKSTERKRPRTKSTERKQPGNKARLLYV